MLAGHEPTWKAAVHHDAGRSWDLEDVREHYVRQLFGVDTFELRYRDAERALDLGRAANADARAAWRSPSGARPASPCAGALVLALRDLRAGAGWGVIDAVGRPKATLLRTGAGAASRWPSSLSDEGLNGLRVHLLNDTRDLVRGVLHLDLFVRGEMPADSAGTDVVIPRPGPSPSRRPPSSRGSATSPTPIASPRPQYDVVAATLLRTDGGLIGQAVHLPLGLGRAREDDVGLAAALPPPRAAPGRSPSRRRRFAEFVVVEVPGFRASDSWFHLLPGACRTVALKPEPGLPRPAPGGEGACPQLRRRGADRRRDVTDTEATATPLWFGSAACPLFGWLHVPAGGRARAGVVICPPVGLEGRKAHFALRALAVGLATSGVAALRFDYAGTGDSAGSVGPSRGGPAPAPAGTTLAPPASERWVESVAAAAELLRSAGAPAVGIVGMRLGATIACTAIGRGVRADALGALGSVPVGADLPPRAAGGARPASRPTETRVRRRGPSSSRASCSTPRRPVPSSSSTSPPPPRRRPPACSCCCDPSGSPVGRSRNGFPQGDAEVGEALGQSEHLDAAYPYQRIPHETLDRVCSWLAASFAGPDVPISAPDRPAAVVARDDAGRPIIERARRIAPGLFVMGDAAADRGCAPGAGGRLRRRWRWRRRSHAARRRVHQRRPGAPHRPGAAVGGFWRGRGRPTASAACVST